MYQVVASDLDGTLLSPDHTLSPYAKETLKLLTARGINFVFATGRHHVDVGQIRDNLEIKSYMITSNGARVHDLDGNLIFAHNLDRDIASDLFGVVNDNPDIITNVYRDDEWFMNRHRPEEMRFFKEAVFQYALYEPGLLEPEGVSKVFFTCDSHEQLLPLEQIPVSRELQKRFFLSSVTVEKGISRLVEEKYLFRRPRIGTFVSENPPSARIRTGPVKVVILSPRRGHGYLPVLRR